MMYVKNFSTKCEWNSAKMEWKYFGKSVYKPQIKDFWDVERIEVISRLQSNDKVVVFGEFN